VRRSHGRRDNDHQLDVRWSLDDFQGETVTLLVDDQLTSPWGFVGTSGFTLD
jgi:hypothetical protein